MQPDASWNRLARFDAVTAPRATNSWVLKLGGFVVLSSAESRVLADEGRQRLQLRVAKDAVRPRHTRILPLQSVASQFTTTIAKRRILQYCLRFDAVSQT